MRARGSQGGRSAAGGRPVLVVAGNGPLFPVSSGGGSPDAQGEGPALGGIRGNQGIGMLAGLAPVGHPLARPAVGSRARRRRAPETLALFVYDVHHEAHFSTGADTPFP